MKGRVKYQSIVPTQLTCCVILGRFISYDILCRNYGTLIFGRMVNFGRSVWPSGCLFLSVQFLFIWPSGFGRLDHTLINCVFIEEIQVTMPKVFLIQAQMFISKAIYFVH